MDFVEIVLHQGMSTDKWCEVWNNVKKIVEHQGKIEKMDDLMMVCVSSYFYGVMDGKREERRKKAGVRYGKTSTWM